MFQATFAEDIGSIRDRIKMIQTTISMLMTSSSIKKIFGLILALGNYMNGGNRTRGQADGFGLEILPKLKDVKSKESNFTLLHFIVIKYIEVSAVLFFIWIFLEVLVTYTLNIGSFIFYYLFLCIYYLFNFLEIRR